KIQSRAAPMPRAGSSWLDSVCLVPNCTSRFTVAWMRAGSICWSRSRRFRSGCCGVAGCPGPGARSAADAGWPVSGAATTTAVAADAERKTRRVGPYDSRFSMCRILAGPRTEVHAPRPDRTDTIDDVAFAYLDLVDALDLTGVLVLRTSVGGWIAAEMALRDTRERISGLVLLNAVGIQPDKPDEITAVRTLNPAEIGAL